MSKGFIRLFAVFIAFVLTAPVFAKSPKVPSVDLPIVDSVRLGGAQLAPGDYTVLIDGNNITVQKGKQVVTSVSGHWEDQKTKASATEYDSNNGQITELYFDGQNRAFVPNR